MPSSFLPVHEGVIFAMESSHAGAGAMNLAKELGAGKKYCCQHVGSGGTRIFLFQLPVLDGSELERIP